jgi:hypothetical protein
MEKIMTEQCQRAAGTSSRTKPSDEHKAILQLCTELNAITKVSSDTPGCLALAALICAAQCAKRAGMSAPVAAALLADYIA